MIVVLLTDSECEAVLRVNGRSRLEWVVDRLDEDHHPLELLCHMNYTAHDVEAMIARDCRVTHFHGTFRMRTLRDFLSGWDGGVLCVGTGAVSVGPMTWTGDNAVFTATNLRGTAVWYARGEADGTVASLCTQVTGDACLGAFGFARCAELRDACAAAHNLPAAVRHLQGRGCTFRMARVGRAALVGKGLELVAAAGVLAERRLRFCFEIDDVVLDVGRPERLASSATANFLRDMHAKGHAVILNTRLGMREEGGNAGKIIAKTAAELCRMLDEQGVPYDELHFGKPDADFYIDRRALNSSQDLYEASGCHHHSEQAGSVLVEANAARELAYYLAIPGAVRKWFPAMLDYDWREGRWYMRAAARGMRFDRLLVRGLLTCAHMELLCVAVEECHAQAHERDACFALGGGRSDGDWEAIAPVLEEYSAAPRPVRMVHGNLELSNVFLSEADRVTLVNMPGPLHGFPIVDWARILISLLGHEEALHRRTLEDAHRHALVDVLFEHVPARSVCAVAAWLLRDASTCGAAHVIRKCAELILARASSR